MPQQTVKLVMDSTSDIPAEWCQKYDIAIVPAFINWGADSFPDDGRSITRAEFYRRMATDRDLPRTSAMPPGVAIDVIRKQLAYAEHVVVFSLAHQFSGIYNTLVLAAREVDPDRVTVVDTGSVTMSMGWQIVAAAEVAAAGGSKDEVIAASKQVRSRCKLIAVIDTLDNLRRSGRVSSITAGVGTLLQIKPIIEVVDGVVNTVQRVRTSSKAIDTLTDMANAVAPFERVAIIHTNDPQGAQNLKTRLGAIVPSDAILIDATPAIGVHVGPGCLGVAYVKRG